MVAPRAGNLLAQAANKAVRDEALKACVAADWNLSKAARALGLIHAANLIRTLRRVALPEYLQAKKSGLIRYCHKGAMSNARRAPDSP